MRVPFAPIFVSLAGFLVGYVAFHPGWRRSAPLSDGSHESFRRAAEAVSGGDLLDKATSQERVSWVLEICNQPAGYARDFALYEAIQRLQPGDFLAAFAELETLGRKLGGMTNDMRQAIAREGMDRWLTVDPAGALRVLRATSVILESNTLKLPPIGSEDLSEVYDVLARREPESLFQTLGSLGEKMDRRDAIRLLLQNSVASNPGRAREWLATLTNPLDREMAEQGYMDGLLDTDPRAAVSFALQEKDEAKRTEKQGHCLWKVSEKNPAMLVELIYLDPKSRLSNTAESLFWVRDMKSIDPYAYVTDRFAENPELISTIEHSQNGWRWVGWLAVRDPAKTADWAKTLPPEAGGDAMRFALTVWGRRDSAGMLDWLQAQPVDELPSKLPYVDFTKADPASYAAWAATLPPGDLRDSTLVSAAAALATQGKRADAMNAFPADFSSESARQAAQNLASTLAAQDLPSTVAWYNSMPAGTGQTAAAAGIISAWAAKSPVDAAAWVGGLPAGQARDGATSAFASAAAATDPIAAAEWVGQIDDPTLRGQATAAVFTQWQKLDAPSALAWLQTFPGAPDSVRRYLLNHVPK